MRNSLKIYFSPVPSGIGRCEELEDKLESECIQYNVNGSDKKVSGRAGFEPGDVQNLCITITNTVCTVE